MSHSYNKIWIHAVWATKYRQPLIHNSIEKQLHQFIFDQLHELDCTVKIINGMPDHMHCLFLLSPQKSIAQVIKQIKGSSAFYINQNNLTPEKFSWQIENRQMNILAWYQPVPSKTMLPFLYAGILVDAHNPCASPQNPSTFFFALTLTT